MRAFMFCFLLQELADHHPRELVSIIENREWFGVVHLGRSEASAHQDGKLFLLLAFDKDLEPAFSF